MRDTGRSLVYQAEQEVRAIIADGGMIEFCGSTLVVPQERMFGDLEGVQRYVDSVLDHVHEDYPRAAYPITVRARGGRTKAHYEARGHIIAVPEHVGSLTSWAMREIVILHEVAHHLASVREQHGPEFRGVFCQLLEKVFSREAGLLLRVAFGERGLAVIG